MFRLLTQVISEAALHVSAVDTSHQRGSSICCGYSHLSSAWQLFMIRLLTTVRARQLYTFRMLTPFTSRSALHISSVESNYQLAAQHVSAVDTSHQLGSSTRFGF